MGSAGSYERKRPWMLVLLFLFIPLATAAVAPPQPAKMISYSRGDLGLTGDLSLDIPLLEIPGGGGMSFPIVAHYQSGIKVDQLPSIIGSGWNLELGSVQRIIMNIADFHDTDDKNTPSPDYKFYSYDPHPDAFLVSFPTGSVKFFNHGTVDSPLFIPETENVPYSLKTIGSCIDLSSYACDYGGFVLTTAEGTRYVYSRQVKETVPDKYDDGNEGRTYPSVPGTMRWLLTAILEANYKDGTRPDADYDPLNSLATNKGNWIAVSYSSPLVRHYVFEGSASIIHKELVYPSEIRTPNYYATFVFSDEGLDGTPIDYMMTKREINPGSPVPDHNSDNAVEEKTKHLQSIYLYRNAGALIKTATFAYGSSTACLSRGLPNIADGTPMGRMMLTGISISGRNGAALPDYSFTYYGGPDMFSATNALTPSCDRTIGNYRDIFGYYTTNPNGYGIDNENYNDPEFDKRDADINGVQDGLEDAKVWSLRTIAYPTGQLVEYSYENDKIYQDFSISGVYNDPSGQNYRYYMGGVRLKSTKVSDTGGANAYTYSIDYSNNLLTNPADSVGVISRFPKGFVEAKLGDSYQFMPYAFNDIDEYVYYPQTKFTPPGNTGYIIRKYSYNENPWGFTSDGLLTGSQLCFTNLQDGSANWCENSADYGGKTIATFLPDLADGFIGFPKEVEYYSNNGMIVREEENFETDANGNFLWSKELDSSNMRVDGLPVYATKVHLPSRSRITVYDPLDSSKKVMVTTTYSYEDKGPIIVGASTTLASHAILPTGTSTCKTNAQGSCVGTARITSTGYAFEDSVNIPDANVRTKLKEKFMLSVPSQIVTPKGTTRTTYQVLTN